jgi:hypothetical protein
MILHRTLPACYECHVADLTGTHACLLGAGALLTHEFILQAILNMDTYQWFVTILDALLSIFIALSVTVAIDRALFSFRYAYMNVSTLQWLCWQLICSCAERLNDVCVAHEPDLLAPCSAQRHRVGLALRCQLLFFVSIVPLLMHLFRRCGCGGRAKSLRSTSRLPRCPTPKSAPCCTQCTPLPSTQCRIAVILATDWLWFLTSAVGLLCLKPM